MATHKKGLRKAKDGNLLDRLSKTKVTDIPGKAKRLGEKVIEKVKSTTVGDVARTAASSTPVGMAYNLAKKAADTKVGKKIKSAIGIDKNGGAVKKKMKNGGSLSGLIASNKRDKGTDVGGAWTKVQNKTLAGATSKAKLTKDKQLGATKQTAKSGAKVSKKK
jgi:hypothetical protein